MVKIRVIGAMISVFSGSILAKLLEKNLQVQLFGEMIYPNILGIIVALIIFLLFEAFIFLVPRRHRY